ncbi:septal ring lytic transglycosylase RlpA family protein [Trichothermofontia sp.]
MNQSLRSGLAIALVTALCSPVGVASVSRAAEVQLTGSPAEPSLSGTDSPVANRPAPNSEAPLSPEVAGPLAALQADTQAASPDVIKVGERQSRRILREETIAKVQSHLFQGRAAATLYVRNIPVLTFLGDADTAESPAVSSAPKLPTPDAALLSPAGNTSITHTPEADVPVKVASRQEAEVAATTKALQPASAADASDPVWRASAVAAKLNQIDREGFDATQIAVKWSSTAPTFSPHDRYLIQIGDETLVTMGHSIILPDTTRDASRDALQATNRLRRLLGDAPPLREVAGQPQPLRLGIATQISRGLQRLGGLTGMASWYGPGFHGNRSASGEVFNQNALTAAHRSLPFGTLVRVTNLDNGRSVVVRINDRGPFSHGRVIDLSAAAARAVGVFYAGIAPVRLEVLNPSSSSRLEN